MLVRNEETNNTINPSVLFVLKMNRVQTLPGSDDKSDEHLWYVLFIANIKD